QGLSCYLVGPALLFLHFHHGNGLFQIVDNEGVQFFNAGIASLPLIHTLHYLVMQWDAAGSTHHHKVTESTQKPGFAEILLLKGRRYILHFTYVLQDRISAADTQVSVFEKIKEFFGAGAYVPGIEIGFQPLVVRFVLVGSDIRKVKKKTRPVF